MNNQRINPVSISESHKNVIVAKGWYKPELGRPGSVVVSRELPGELVLTAGMTLNMNKNIKREGDKGLNDPDFTLTILLPIAQADELISEMKKGAASFKQEDADEPR